MDGGLCPTLNVLFFLGVLGKLFKRRHFFIPREFKYIFYNVFTLLYKRPPLPACQASGALLSPLLWARALSML